MRDELKFLSFLMFLAGIFFAGSFFLSSARGEGGTALSLDAVSSPFDQVEIAARSAYVYDARMRDILYAKNEGERLPLASLTKVMSALVASELAPPGMAVTVTREALLEAGDSGLYAGERWYLKDLLDFSLTSSSNDGIKAVALAFGSTDNFVLKMNERADQLGMMNTYFWNVTGLDETEHKGGAYGTARDMALLFDYILRERPEMLEATRERELTLHSLDYHMHKADNTSYIVTDLPGVKASKTGYTDVAGGNLVVAFDPEVGRLIIIAVLGSTANDRFEDVLKLMRASMEYLQ